MLRPFRNSLMTLGLEPINVPDKHQTKPNPRLAPHYDASSRRFCTHSYCPGTLPASTLVYKVWSTFPLFFSIRIVLEYPTYSLLSSHSKHSRMLSSMSLHSRTSQNGGGNATKWKRNVVNRRRALPQSPHSRTPSSISRRSRVPFPTVLDRHPQSHRLERSLVVQAQCRLPTTLARWW